MLRAAALDASLYPAGGLGGDRLQRRSIGLGRAQPDGEHARLRVVDRGDRLLLVDRAADVLAVREQDDRAALDAGVLEQFRRGRDRVVDVGAEGEWRQLCERNAA